MDTLESFSGACHPTLRVPVTFSCFLVFLFLVPVVLAEDWTTTDGKTYKNVKILEVEVDSILIYYDDNGAATNDNKKVAEVPLATLPPELQRTYKLTPPQVATAAAVTDRAAKFYRQHVEEVRANPFWICGRVSYRQKGTITSTDDENGKAVVTGYSFVVDVTPENVVSAHSHVRHYPPRKDDTGEIPYELRKNIVGIGSYYVESKTTYDDRAPIFLIVYPAGTTLYQGYRTIIQYSDDADEAALATLRVKTVIDARAVIGQ